MGSSSLWFWNKVPILILRDIRYDIAFVFYWGIYVLQRYLLIIVSALLQSGSLVYLYAFVISFISFLVAVLFHFEGLYAI